MTRRRKLPPFVECSRSRHGKVRLYFRKKRGLRMRLPSDIGSPEFAQAYHAALTGNPLPVGPTSRPTVPYSIEALIRSYRATTTDDGNLKAFSNLRPATQAGYLLQMETLRREHGHRSVAGLDRERVKRLLAPLANKPGAAFSRLKVLRVLVRHAINIGWLNHDPTLGLKRPQLGEIRSWTEDEISRFEARWPVGSSERLAFALMLYTGQRRSDVHRMVWTEVAGNTIRVTQQKTGAKLSIPLHPQLGAILAATKREHVAILTDSRGKPFSAHTFSLWMRRAITAAGLPLDAQPHGLRKAAARRLAEAGCSANEIMAVTGHKSLAEAERYTREADQARLASAAISKLEQGNWAN